MILRYWILALEYEIPITSLNEALFQTDEMLRAD